MKLNIYNVSNKICHLFYGNYLVVNLPVKKVQECLVALNTGELYESKRVLAAMGNHDTEAKNANICRTFILDEKFRLIIRDGGYDLVLLRLGQNVILPHAGLPAQKSVDDMIREHPDGPGALQQWLARNLEARGFEQRLQLKPSYIHKDLLMAAVMFCAALILLYAIFFGKYGDVIDDLYKIWIIAASIAALLASAAIVRKRLKAKKNPTEPVYVKLKDHDHSYN